MSCPDFSAEQPFGPAQMPQRLSCYAPEGECPICDYETYDMRRRRIILVKTRGLRFGLGPAKSDVPGIEFACGCVVM